MERKFLFLPFIVVSFLMSCDYDVDKETFLCTFPMENVILHDSWIKQRENLTINYLKSLDPDRLLHNFRINAGLSSDAFPLDGWESPQIGLRGHFVGHYLSAVSHVVRRYDDIVLKQKLNYLIDELAKCQLKLGNGYLSAFPETDFDVLETRFGGVWAPYYTYHKLMQGLLDVYVNTQNVRAYDMLLNMADYVDARMGRLDDRTISQMLYTTQANPSNEAGGMNDVLYKVYEVSGNEKYLKLARKFDRKWFLMPLANNEDILSGLHANTHIVLVNGFAECYELTQDPVYYDAVVNFWDMLIGSHAYVNGSSSGPRPNATTPTSLVAEHWGRPGQLSNTLTKKIAETCVTHNTQKLTSSLFQWTKKTKYADAYMNTFYNSVLSSQNSRTGDFVYHLPLGSPRKKEFLDNNSDFRCCNGTSIEAFSSLNSNIYFHDGKNLWINLYVPSSLKWKDRGLELVQNGDFLREQKVEFVLRLENPQDFSVNLFIPSWSRSAQIFINDKLEGEAVPNSFFVMNRKWNCEDCITICFHFDFRIEAMPDDDKMISIFYGPMLLAFETAEEVFLSDSAEIIKTELKVIDQKHLLFSLDDGGRSYSLKPLLDISDEAYSVYVQTNKLSDEKWE